MINLLKNRNFTLLFTGNFVSRIGSTFYNFAVGWFILTLTASPLKMAIYIALGAIIELIVSPLGGVLADRLNKVRTLYITDYIRGITVICGGLFIFMFNQETYLLLLLYIITIILALNDALFFPAASALMPEVVEDSELNQANAFFSLIGSVQTIIGVLLAGLFYTLLGIEWIFIINGISFIISAFSEMFIRTHYKKPTGQINANSVKTDFLDGLAYMKNKTGLLQFMFAALFINFASAPIFANALPYLFNLELNKTPIHLSVVHIIFSTGMILGGVLVGSFGNKVAIKTSIKHGMMITGIGLLTVSLLLHLVSSSRMSYPMFMSIFLPVFFLSAVGNMWLNIPFSTGIVRSVEPYVRGRVLSIMGTLSAGLMPISYILAGMILEYSGLSMLVLLVCIVGAIPFYIMIKGKRVNLLLESL
jgi:MFS transporter, DHA3 family, macrolide efflux protein